MRIRIKLFAILRDQAGLSDAKVDLPEGATVAGARQQMLNDFPALAPYLNRVAYAVNLEYAKPEDVLHEGDELALLPPVSGG